MWIFIWIGVDLSPPIASLLTDMHMNKERIDVKCPFAIKTPFSPGHPFPSLWHAIHPLITAVQALVAYSFEFDSGISMINFLAGGDPELKTPIPRYPPPTKDCQTFLEEFDSSDLNLRILFTSLQVLRVGLAILLQGRRVWGRTSIWKVARWGESVAVSTSKCDS